MIEKPGRYNLKQVLKLMLSTMKQTKVMNLLIMVHQGRLENQLQLWRCSSHTWPQLATSGQVLENQGVCSNHWLTTKLCRQSSPEKETWKENDQIHSVSEDSLWFKSRQITKTNNRNTQYDETKKNRIHSGYTPI